MEKICSYETLFAVNGTLPEEECKALVEKFVALINENASDVDVNEWGKRKFAYPINYVNEGYYVLVSYKSNAAFPAELDRVFGITEGVLRFMTTIACAKKAVKSEAKAEESAEAAEEAPAAEATEA